MTILGHSRYNLDDLMIVDSGAEISVIRDTSYLSNVNYNPPDQLLGAGDQELTVNASGTLRLKFGNKLITIKALASQDSTCNLISLHDLEKAGLIIDLQNRDILNRNNKKKIGDIIDYGRYICIPLSSVCINQGANRVNHVSKKLKMAFLHRLFGHINIKTIKDSISKKLIKNISLTDVDWSNIDKFQCTDCMKGKSTKHRHIVGSRLKYQNNYGPFQYIHSDLFGPVTGVSATSPTYFISFTDECTRFRWVYPMRTKSADSIYNIFDHLVRQIGTQFNTKILSFHMDRGSEYTNSDMQELYQKHGIIPIYSSTADSSSNGIAERSNLTFLNDCRTLLVSSHLPNSLWFNAVEFATLMRNAFINSTNKISPRGKAGLAGLDASTILPFGQELVVHNHKVKNKLHPRGITGYALSPSKESHGYLIYIPTTKQIIDTSNYSLVKNSGNNTTADNSIFDDLISIYEQDIDEVNLDSAKTNPITNSNEATLGGTDTLEIPESTTANIAPDTGLGGIADNNNDPIHLNTDDTSLDDYTNSIPLDALEDIPDDDTTNKSNLIETSTNDINQEDTAAADFTTSNDDSQETQSHTLVPNQTNNNSTILDNTNENATNAISGDKYQILPSLGGRKKIEDMLNKKGNSLSSFQNPRKRSRRDIGDPIETRKDLKDKKNSKDDSIRPKKLKRRVNYIKAIKHVMQTKQVNPSLNYFDAIVNNKSTTESTEYKAAYDKEINQLIKMNTWDNNQLYDAKDIPSKKIINSMFIFTTKRDGTRKCRFVARGDQQHPSTYDENAIANTVHHYALMTTLSLALDYKKYIVQLDISSAYLYADLSEELYIRTPPHMSKKGKVMRLRKSLYGLKQSGANWYNTIKEYLTKKCGLQEINGWSCVFKNKDLTVCLFVDDMVVTASNIGIANKFIDKLKEKFDTKIVNTGEIDSQGYAYYDILGLEIEYKFGSKMQIGMEKSLQTKLTTLDVNLNHSGKTLKAPAPPGTVIIKCVHDTTEDQYKKNVRWLQRIIGLASYVAYKYRFDILFYVNTLAQHTLFPSEQVKRLARLMIQYLWDTKDKKLVWYSKRTKQNDIHAITDAAFANLDGYGSQVGYFISLNDKIIGGSSSRAKLTCTSSTESEIYAVSRAIPMINSLRLLIPNISTTKLVPEIKCDSISTINIATSEDDKKFRNRYFGTKAMRIRDEVKQLGLHMKYINTEENTADILTKPLSYKRFLKLTSNWIN